jgi:hypothetical protein
MTLNADEIRKLRRELERDIDALNRVETLLERRSSLSSTERVKVADDGATGDSAKLTPQTLEVLRASGSTGLRATEVVKELMQRGYPFKNKESAASSVATTLKRLVKQGKVKKANKAYTLAS